MPTYGTLKRAQPRIEILRGFDPNEPTKLTQSHPVAAGEVVKSGQIVTEYWNSADEVYEWKVGIQLNKGADVSGTQVFFAIDDATDHDIIEAGTLPALSAIGEFEIEIPWFVDTEATAFKSDGVAKDLDSQALNSGVPVYAAFNDDTVADVSVKGSIRTKFNAETGDMIRVGFLTRNHGIKSVAATNSNVVNTSVVSLQLHQQVVTLA